MTCSRSVEKLFRLNVFQGVSKIVKYRIHTFKFLISSAVAFFCLLLALYFFTARCWAAGIVFLALFAVYTVPAYQLGRTVAVDADGVTVTAFFGQKCFFPWDDIQEAGIIGIKVLNGYNARSTGPKYIYFSKKSLSKDELFNTALKWPPEDMVYMRYDPKRLKAVRKYWRAAIRLYNTGNLVIEPPIKE